MQSNSRQSFNVQPRSTRQKGMVELLRYGPAKLYFASILTLGYIVLSAHPSHALILDSSP